MTYIKVSIGIFLALAASRFIPHPPNFTSLFVLSFYIPAVFGLKYIPVVIFSLLFTDLVIGFHSTVLFTWGSVGLIGLISRYFNKSMMFRIFGALSGVLIFFLLTNLGVWLNGSYGYDLNGLISCYILAIPFFGYSFISTLLFSVLIETVFRIYQKRFVNFVK